jgi:hypothetical protein
LKKSVVNCLSSAWDGELVRQWLNSRLRAARLEDVARATPAAVIARVTMSMSPCGVMPKIAWSIAPVANSGSMKATPG